MNRRIFIQRTAATAMAVGSVLEGTPAVHAQPKYAWKMVTAWPKDFPGVGTGASRLARAIERMSDKRITGTVYSDGELVPAFDTFDAVASGTAEMGHTSALYWQAKHVATPFFATVPFGLNAQEMAAWLYYGGGQALWDELYAPFNLKPFAAGSSGAQMGGWFNNAVLATLGNVSQEVVAAVAAYDPLARKVYDAFHALRQTSKAPLDRPLQSAYGLAIVVPLILDVADEVKGALVGIIPLDTLEQRVAERTEQLAEANAEITALNTQLQAENLRMGAELEVTRKLQQMLLPTAEELQQIADLDIACYMEPADEVGGDYYDVLQHNGQIKIGIGDVTGHGLESGVVMVMTQAIVRALLANGETDPVRFLATLNRALYGNVQRMGTDNNLTLALLDYVAGEVKLSGQHEGMLVVRDGGTVEVVDTIDLGFPAALTDDIADFIQHTTVRLQPGDGVVLYTDGVTEAEDVAGQQYGLARLCTLVSQHWTASAEMIKERVVTDVHQHIGAQTMYDDITLVVVKRR